MRAIVTTGLLALLPIVPATAQETSRYTMEKTPDGYVRMDNVTGRMSLCTDRSGQLVCKLAADDRDALMDEIDRLAQRMDQVEARLDAIQKSPPAALPEEKDVETALDIMERFFRRFMGIMKEFETPPADGANPEQRT